MQTQIQPVAATRTTPKGMQYTPGPWRAGPVLGFDGQAIFHTDQSKPGKWQRRLDNKTGIFIEADARLIAAAPDLLVALMAVVQVADRSTVEFDLAHAAIAKVQGGAA